MPLELLVGGYGLEKVALGVSALPKRPKEGTDVRTAGSGKANLAAPPCANAGPVSKAVSTQRGLHRANV